MDKIATEITGVVKPRKEIKIKEKKINREEKKTEKPAEEKKEIEVNKEEKKWALATNPRERKID